MPMPVGAMLRGGFPLSVGQRKAETFPVRPAEVICWPPVTRDAATPLASRDTLLVANNAIYDHLRKLGLLMHVGSAGTRSKTEVIYFPAKN